jgi:hypothetical protein
VLPLQGLVDDVAGQLAVAHQQPAQPQVLARGGGEHRVAGPEVQLALLVAAL